MPPPGLPDPKGDDDFLAADRPAGPPPKAFLAGGAAGLDPARGRVVAPPPRPRPPGGPLLLLLVPGRAIPEPNAVALGLFVRAIPEHRCLGTSIRSSSGF